MDHIDETHGVNNFDLFAFSFAQYKHIQNGYNLQAYLYGNQMLALLFYLFFFFRFLE